MPKPATTRPLGALLKSACDTEEKAEGEMLNAETTSDSSLRFLAFAP